MPRIRVKTGPMAGRTFEITDDVITIGRDESQTIQILDQGVSRRHAEIFRIGDIVFLRDLDSTNGSYINKVRVTEEPLRSGDEIRIGTTILVFEDPAGETATQMPQVEAVEAAPVSEATTTLELRKGADREDRGGTTSRRVGSRLIACLDEAATMLRSDRPVREIIGEFLRWLVEKIGASQVLHLRYAWQSGQVEAVGLAESDRYGGPRKVSRTILRRVVEGNRAIMSTDAAVDDRFALSESVVLQKIKSVIAAPLCIFPDAADILYVYSDDPERPFGVADLEFVGAIALQLGLLLQAERRMEQTREAAFSALAVWARAAERACGRTPGHAERAARYAAAIAAEMGMGPADVDAIRAGALLHDVGRLLTGTGAGDDPEARHAAAAAEFLAAEASWQRWIPFAAMHHEWADGSGKPQGLPNARIPREARIVIAACALDRRLEEAGPQKAGQVLQTFSTEAGRAFDDEVVRAVVLCHRNGTLFGGAPTK